MRIGVDAGGTFTDFVVLHDDGRWETFKLRSNPRAPAEVILAGLRKLAGGKGADVVHGSTVATNALLEQKGVRTAFVTTEGFEDLLEIGRQNRPELYNLTPVSRALLIPRELCFGVKERAHHDGTVARRPSAAELARLAGRLKRSGAKSIAICFLHSYRNSTNERAVAKALQREGVYVCVSHEISPEFREYERASTTAVNAYVGPLMDAYLSELDAARGFRISIMQSNGGFLSAHDAAKHAARTVLSGPAGGVIGAMRVAHASGYKKLLGFDMGGTSTDVSLIDGAPRETTEASIDGLPVRVPMLDIHTVGAGGGSIARIDAGGLLHVGPESAGADPGPACYGKGSLPTVTDAHVVLGHITSLLGGSMPVDAARAAKAIDGIAKGLKLTRKAAAEGIIRVANANMERAIRVVSVERGYDPRDFALLAFGGCGGLHACDIAQELGMKTVIVPRYAGMLSALGMVLADAVRDYSAGVLGRTDLEAEFAKLEKRALRESPGAVLERSADLRYVGQSYELSVAWPVGGRFHRAHAKTYGYARPDREAEVVTIRVRAKMVTQKARLQGEQVTKPMRGPALLADYGSTTLIPAGWRYHRDAVGNLIVQAM
jgi:N-methylhydantoinase A